MKGLMEDGGEAAQGVEVPAVDCERAGLRVEVEPVGGFRHAGLHKRLGEAFPAMAVAFGALVLEHILDLLHFAVEQDEAVIAGTGLILEHDEWSEGGAVIEERFHSSSPFPDSGARPAP